MPSIDRLVLRVAIPVTVAVGIVAGLIGALVAADAGKAVLGAAIGIVIVVAFFTVGQVVVGAVLRTAPQMAMSVALMVYLVKIGILFIFIVLFQGTTALFEAARAGRAEAVRYLASVGADVTVAGTGFDTPLVAAARTGTLETVQALLEAKADPAVRTERNMWTALTAAAHRGDVAMVNLLAPVSSGSLDEALQIASLKGVPQVVDALLRHGADVFSRSKENKTPLMYAAEFGHADAVRLLLLAGSNKLLIDNNRQTAADLALARGHTHIPPVLDDPKLVPVEGVPAGSAVAAAEAGVPAESVVPQEEAAAGSEAAGLEAQGTGEADVAAVVPGATAVPDATLAPSGAGLAAADGPVVVDPELSAAVAEGAPFASPDGEDGVNPVAGAGVPGRGAADRPSGRREYPRLQGVKLSGLADGSTEAVKERVRLRDFREGQLPIVLEEVPAAGEAARIRVLGRGGSAPEIVPAGGVIGDTGLELVRVERKFASGKMGQGRLVDVSHAVVRERSTGRRHVVHRHQTAPSTEATALISTGVDGEVYEVQEGDEFTAGGKKPSRYKVIDLRPTQMVIENLETGETATVARGDAR